MNCSKLKDIENIGQKSKIQQKLSISNINENVRDPKNIDKYIKVINILLEYKNDYYEIYEYEKFKKFFNKKLDKSIKRNDIKVSKLHLVSCYKYMIENNIIENDDEFKALISKVPTRNASGVNSFAILLSPNPNGQTFSCEHNCYYCPEQSIKNGAKQDVARSYLLEEPAVARGFQNGWDAYLQIIDRFNSLISQGHTVDKIEIIIEGGTFTNFPKDYLNEFFRDIYYACNVYYDIMINPNYEPRKRLSLKNEINISVYDSKIKLIGICIETRPDCINNDWIKYFRYLGVTRIQIGVQHTDNNLLKKINRGHTFEESCKAVKLLKDNCFKVDIHLMPDLPFTTSDNDIKMFNKVFNTDIMCPDGVKIYPCQVTIFTVIKKWYDSGKYVPYSESNFPKFMEVIKYALENVPRYVRVSRIIRDFDFNKHVKGGNPYSNLKQMATDQLRKEGKYCIDIRTREIGRHPKYKYDNTSKVKVTKYNDEDYIIEMVSSDDIALFGFIRLRIPINNSIKKYNPVFPILKYKGLIRELHVYNTLVSVGKKNKTTKTNKTTSQHKGIGKLLIAKAEKIAYDNYCDGTAIISGEGVRLYYQNIKYKTIDTFEVKFFKFKKSYFNTIIILSPIICLCAIIFIIYYTK